MHHTMKPAIDEEKALKDLLARGFKLPPWPRVLGELQQMLAAGNTDVRAVAKVIGKDPGLTAMVFKASKSPVISRGKKNLDRLDQILMVMGIKQVLNLVQAVALTTALSKANRRAFDEFWSRSAEIAEIAALIAEDRVTVCNIFADQAYLAGIFWECGVPVLMQRFPDYCKNVAFDQGLCGPNIKAEDDRFDADHAAVGYLVARHWKLPDFIAQAILYHGEMPDEELGPVRSLVAILLLANHYHNLSRERDTAYWAALGAEVLAELGFHAEEEAEFQADILERFNAMAT